MEQRSARRLSLTWHSRAVSPAFALQALRRPFYGVEDLESGFMVNHVGGPAIYDALVAVAQACDLVIIPVGCATALIDDRQRVELPEVLAADAVRVNTGEDLRRLIESG